MMKQTLEVCLFLVLLLWASPAMSRQNEDNWKRLTGEGRELMAAGHYADAARRFEAALSAVNGQPFDLNRHVQTLINLAEAAGDAGDSSKAEKFYREALAFFDSGQPSVSRALLLNALGETCRNQGRDTDARGYYEQALAVLERVPGTVVERSAVRGNLALLLRTQHRYQEAESIFLDVLRVREQYSGPDSVEAGKIYSNLADLYLSAGDHERAQAAAERAASICERKRGISHPACVPALTNLASVYYSRRLYAAAVGILERVVELAESELATDNPHKFVALSDLAAAYAAQGAKTRAEEMYRRALESAGNGTDPEALSLTLLGYAKLLKHTHRKHQAETLEARAKSLRPQRATVDIMVLTPKK